MSQFDSTEEEIAVGALEQDTDQETFPADVSTTPSNLLAFNQEYEDLHRSVTETAKSSRALRAELREAKRNLETIVAIGKQRSRSKSQPKKTPESKSKISSVKKLRKKRSTSRGFTHIKQRGAHLKEGKPKMAEEDLDLQGDTTQMIDDKLAAEQAKYNKEKAALDEAEKKAGSSEQAGAVGGDLTSEDFRRILDENEEQRLRDSQGIHLKTAWLCKK